MNKTEKTVPVFAKGDEVECIRDHGTSGQLVKGQKYTINSYDNKPIYAGDPAVTVVGIWGPWMAERFKKV